MSLRVTDHFEPEVSLEAANEKLQAIRCFVFPRVAACSLVPICRILGLPDEPDMSTETRIELIKDARPSDPSTLQKGE